MIILETKNLCKSFDGVKALDNVNIEVEKSKLTLIMGPNGSGKSTLINAISGFLKVDAGKVIFEGKDITNREPHEIYNYGIVRTFQNPEPLKSMTVLENVLIGRKHSGENIPNALFPSRWLKEEEELVERAFKILEFLKLDHRWDHPSKSLSGGQMKLLEIGRALITDPKLIIMDEPIAGVAPGLAHDIFSHVVQLKNKGISFLIVEHRLDIVLNYVDNLYVMFNGSVIAHGKGREEIEKVLNDPKVIEVYIGD
ncbi:MAG TPA: ABC transporter ATP-binding protein [Methanothermococcus okinawensis]|uniref:Probable branched-chain amino acid transport ATP-binding protein LivG n=1 Tax=Methanothermococcus okinawensis TaxID=155863 RepID=A0A832ZAE2_9EURY|nr:ABC transporter ATP-binding protein [Methanothermococcus okinawensis]HIP91761.1 ABC transporter ATP-binding protein [Methanothermococcus okinawensis]